MDKKKCSVCRELKEKTEFYRNKGHRDGFDNLCKSCRQASRKVQYEENKEVEKKNALLYHKKHRVKSLKRMKEYYQENHDKLSEKARNRYRERIKNNK